MLDMSAKVLVLLISLSLESKENLHFLRGAHVSDIVATNDVGFRWNFP